MMSRYRSRLEKNSKDKTNKVLNIMIGVVLLLIVIVAGSIFLGNDRDQATSGKENQEETSSDSKENDGAEEDDSSSAGENSNTNEEASSDEEDSNSTNSPTEEDTDEEKTEDVAVEPEGDEGLIVEESDEENVKQTIVHPDWKPVGTTQTNGHNPSYEEDSADWKERLKALSYASGIPQDQMTLWWIEANGSPQSTVGTISNKNGSEVYRVYLDWVDGQGWKPTKIQELIENDKMSQ